MAETFVTASPESLSWFVVLVLIRTDACGRNNMSIGFVSACHTFVVLGIHLQEVKSKPDSILLNT